MKVLITGASGFLGGHMAELFIDAGHDVRGLVRHTSNTELLESLGAMIVRGDLKDPESLRQAVQDVDAVVHAASTMGGIPQEYTEATVKGTRSLLDAAQEAGVTRFVHISSIAVYKLQKLAEGQEITEEFPYEDREKFLTNYSRSKIEAERAVREFSERSSMQVIVLRPGLLYGPRGDWNLPRMGFPLGKHWYLVVGNGRTPLPVCYVRNCARAAFLAATTDVHSGVFNIVDDEVFTQKEYLKRLKKDARPRLKILPFPYLLARAMGWATGLALGLLGRGTPLHRAHLVACHRHMRYCNEKAKQILNWQPETPKEQALTETTQYHARREAISRRANYRLLGTTHADATAKKCCVVGCGMIAREHLKTLKKMKNAQVLALCDASEDAAEELASEYEVPRTYADLEEMLDTEEPDVLHILTPPHTHASYTELAAERKCHVLVEKPMAMNAKEAMRMRDVAADNGVHLCVDHNHLYDRTIVQMRRMVEEGALGRILWVDSYYGFNLGENLASRYMAPGGSQHWTFDLPGGLYQNLIPHPLCLAIELLGQPAEVTAHARYGRVVPHQPTDELRVMLETEEAGGLVTVSLAASPRLQYLTVWGTKMILHVDLLNKWLVCHTTPRGLPKAVGRALTNLRHSWTIFKGTVAGMFKVLTRRWTPYEGIDLVIKEFYSALEDGRQPPVTAQEGVDVMKAMDRAWDSAGPSALKWKSGRHK